MMHRLDVLDCAFGSMEGGAKCDREIDEAKWVQQQDSKQYMLMLLMSSKYQIHVQHTCTEQAIGSFS